MLNSRVDVERLNRYHEQVYAKTQEYLTQEEREWLAEVTAPIGEF